MLATKFRPQFNETIKLLQFRKLCRFKGESAEEWMGRVCVAVAECNYREVDQQLKEKFIHGLNDKIILVEGNQQPKAIMSKQLVMMYWHGLKESKCSRHRQPY